MVMSEAEGAEPKSIKQVENYIKVHEVRKLLTSRKWNEEFEEKKKKHLSDGLHEVRN